MTSPECNEAEDRMEPVERVDVLDHGYVELVDAWGGDESIIEAARMSTQKGFEGWGEDRWRCSRALCDWKGRGTLAAPKGRNSRCPKCGVLELVNDPGDEKLLAFLWKNRHMTPFEMAGATFEVQAPIFVFREWHRHRTQSFNEMSARYAPLPDVNYVPTVERLMMNAGGTNKQAGTVAGSKELVEDAAGAFQANLRSQYMRCQREYEDALSVGVPKELARLVLPVGRYSRMRASANLRNWLQFLELREASNAQWEIRQYANAVHAILAEKFPRTMKLFEEGRRP